MSTLTIFFIGKVINKIASYKQRFHSEWVWTMHKVIWPIFVVVKYIFTMHSWAAYCWVEGNSKKGVLMSNWKCTIFLYNLLNNNYYLQEFSPSVSILIIMDHTPSLSPLTLHPRHLSVIIFAGRGLARFRLCTVCEYENGWLGIIWCSGLNEQTKSGSNEPFSKPFLNLLEALR